MSAELYLPIQPPASVNLNPNPNIFIKNSYSQSLRDFKGFRDIELESVESSPSKSRLGWRDSARDFNVSAAVFGRRCRSLWVQADSYVPVLPPGPLTIVANFGRLMLSCPG